MFFFVVFFIPCLVVDGPHPGLWVSLSPSQLFVINLQKKVLKNDAWCLLPVFYQIQKI